MLFIYLSAIENEDTRITFERIYRKYYAVVYRRIYKILKNKQDTEDMSQENWFKTVKNFDLLLGKSEITIISYIMRIARNEAISLCRKRNKEQSLISDFALVDTISENDFFASLENHSEDFIVECIKSLDPMYSDALVYYYLYRYSVNDIAKLLMISEDAVRKRIFRGRDKLAQLLGKEGIL